jgi:2-dehydropantoate 2-reductase
MKIVVMGSGGVGGYYGALLANQGKDVTFIARGQHLRAMREKGLQVYSVHGGLHIQPTQATDDPSQVGTADLVLFCTKTYSTEESAAQIKPIIGKDTTVLSLQNGVESYERLGELLGAEHVLPGATWISSAVEAPGVIRQVSLIRRIALGELDGSVSGRAKAVVDVFKGTGVDVRISDAILTTLWTKFIFIAVASSMGPLTRLTIGQYRTVPETRTMMQSLLGEVKAVSDAVGAGLQDDIVEKTMGFVDMAEPGIKPSMQLDVEAGKPSELDSLVGVIGRKGRALGIPTPTFDMVMAVLLPVEKAARDNWKIA